jgi:hypothetical protein
MGYCRHKKAGGIHICSSQQFSLWKQGIDQGDRCDVHYWEVESERIAAIVKDQQVTINLLKNQADAFRKELAYVNGASHTEWHAGQPPHIGWWYTFGGYWRWWNGHAWSVSVMMYSSAGTAMQCANTPYLGLNPILWSDYYPAYARVPRVNQNESKI